jgi:hypothetical protein
MKKFEIPQNINLEKSLESKSAPVARAIIGDDKRYNPNTPRVQSKLEKSVNEVLEKHNLGDSEEVRDEVSFKILKNALEKVSDDLGGSLSVNESLENKYFELLLSEAILRKEKISDHRDLISLVNLLDEKNILDDKRKGDLINELSNELLDNSL